jgi:hypothetical protein
VRRVSAGVWETFDGKKPYNLSDQRMQQYAAQKVSVKGTLVPNTGFVKVDSISSVK